MNEDLDTDVQPTGVSIERTMDVVASILADPDFSAEVANHNKWVGVSDQRDVAIAFLACRYQWAVDLLSRRTVSLKRELDGLASSVRQIEDRLARGN